MVADFEVDGSFQTVARLEQLWKEAAEDIARKMNAELPEAKITASGSSDEPIQAELQDRRGSTGDIKNITFRGGRGANEKMSKSQFVRLEELWKKKWSEENFNSDPRAGLKGEDKKLFNKLMHMADKQGFYMDEENGRLRSVKNQTLAYSGGMDDIYYRFLRTLRGLQLDYEYDETNDPLHIEIQRKFVLGDLKGISNDLADWEIMASDFMPEEQAKRYRDYVETKLGAGDTEAQQRHMKQLEEKLADDGLEINAEGDLEPIDKSKVIASEGGKMVVREKVVDIKTKKGKNYRLTVDTGKFHVTTAELTTLFKAMGTNRKGSLEMKKKLPWIRSLRDENGNPVDAEEVFTAEGVAQEELDRLWKEGNEVGFTTRS
jgi:hypothetical protein